MSVNIHMSAQVSASSVSPTMSESSPVNTQPEGAEADKEHLAALAAAVANNASTLRLVNATEHLEISDDLIEKVARMTIFDTNSVGYLAETSWSNSNALPRQEMVKVVDVEQLANSKGGDDKLAELTGSISMDSFVQGYLMKGETLIHTLSFKGIQTGNLNDKGERTGPARSAGKGKMYLTSKRMIFVSHNSAIGGEFLSKQAHDDSQNEGASLIAAARAKIEALEASKAEASSGGVLGSITSKLPSMPAVPGCASCGCSGDDKSSRFAQQSRKLHDELADLLDLHPELKKKNSLISLLRSLHVLPSCSLDCVIKFCEVRCGCGECIKPCTKCCGDNQSAVSKYVVNMQQHEEFDVQQVPIDRFLQAEMSWNIATSTASVVDRDDKFTCLGCCSETKWSASKEPILQKKPTKEVLITFAVILPPWGQRALMKVRLGADVPIASLSGFLSNFHSIVPNYGIEHMKYAEHNEMLATKEGYGMDTKMNVTKGQFGM